MALPFMGRKYALSLPALAALAMLAGLAQAQTGPNDGQGKKEEKAGSLPAVTVRAEKKSLAEIVLGTREADRPARMTDGASMLKEVPNMSLMRRGQQSSDPAFRGLGGSRLAITANDQFLYGGCGIRNDTPTAYINPQTYDAMIVTKGPQTVLKGPGLVAGAVEFVRHPRVYDRFETDFSGGLTTGSFKYLDAYGDFALGNPLASLRAIATKSRSDDYKDGDGNEVRSWYDRKGASLNLGLTPTKDLRFELFADANRSQAKFAHLHLDAGKIDRDSIGAKVELSRLSPLVQKVSFELGRSHQDIIMGRQFRSLRAGGNPDRVTRNAKLSSELSWGANHTVAGLEWFGDEHRARPAYRGLARSTSEISGNLGFFAENTLDLGHGNALVAGLRHDHARATTYPGFWFGNKPQTKNKYRLTAGFGRYEFVTGGWRSYAGLGYTERAPDFWERGDNRDVRPEKSLQLDVGTQYHVGALRLNGSAFANYIKDYILTEKDNPRLNDLAGLTSARNINAMRYGFELGAEYVMDSSWKLGGDMSYTWGRNNTDRVPLGQTPPLELRLRAGYDTEQAALLLSMRAVARQHRVSIGDGNINGVDIGPTPGFAVFGIHGHWRFNKLARLSFGIDNLFDRTYAEHLTKAVQTPEFFSGLGINPNIGSTTRINEPGRSIWVRLDLKI